MPHPSSSDSKDMALLDREQNKHNRNNSFRKRFNYENWMKNRVTIANTDRDEGKVQR